MLYLFFESILIAVAEPVLREIEQNRFKIWNTFLRREWMWILCSCFTDQPTCFLSCKI